MRFQRIGGEEASCASNARKPGVKTLDAAEEQDHLRGPQPGEVPVTQEGEVGNRGRISQNMIST